MKNLFTFYAATVTYFYVAKFYIFDIKCFFLDCSFMILYMCALYAFKILENYFHW